MAPMPDSTSEDAFLSKKKAISILQWLVVIVTSYLLLFSKGDISEDPWAYALIVVFFASTVVIQRLPEAALQHRHFDIALLVFDTALISLSIYMNRDLPWDLFLFYFFILFLAAIGENMIRIVIGSVLISAIYLGLQFEQGKGLAQINPEIFVRIPFLFGSSILYGYLSENAKKEKHRAESAEQKERLKMDLVSALAHDIKNPLGIIMGYAETLADQLTGRDRAKEHLEILDRIQESAQRIVNLVTGFLEASKAEAGKLSVEERPVELNSLIREVAQQQMGDLRKKNISLDVVLDEGVPTVLGDKAQLDRVLWNLVGNAIKFTPAGGKITVSSRRDDRHVCVAVKDTGIGIPKEELPLLFSQFRRLKGSAKVEGTGLGLFIVKTIIEAHKGTVQADSEDGKGSTFTVRVPIRA
ncbi:MAG: HAMP domain-containing histidine kinase [Deltaproteobacteria bacterium]|nr:HAMP domain-containing histidine kinase [Deltaproteobacteria bacterium]